MGRRKTVLEETPALANIGDLDGKTILKPAFNVGDLEGIGPKKKKALEDAGVKTPFDIVFMGSQEISQVTGMDKEDAIKIVNKVKTQLEEQKLIPKEDSATELFEWQKKIFHISSGSETFDVILHGGIASQAVTEISGPDGAGKTQFVNTLAINALKNNLPVYYMDCEGTFEKERTTEIARERGVPLENLFDKIIYRRALDTDEVETLVKNIVKIVLDNNIKLIILDGALGLYRAQYDKGRAELNVRQNDIKPVMRHLRLIAELLNVAVILTNQVMGNPNPYDPEPIKPVMGFVVGHFVKYRIKLNKASGIKRSARLTKSPFHAMADCVFYLNAEGISGYDDLSKKKKDKEAISAELTKSLIDESALLAVGNESNIQG